MARRSAKLIANFSATMVTSLPSFSLSLSVSLSLSPNVPHAQYRKRFRASYNKQNKFTPPPWTMLTSPNLRMISAQERMMNWVQFPFPLAPRLPFVRYTHLLEAPAARGGSRMRTEHLKAIVEGGDSSRLHELILRLVNGRIPTAPYDLTSVVAVPHHMIRQGLNPTAPDWNSAYRGG